MGAWTWKPYVAIMVAKVMQADASQQPKSFTKRCITKVKDPCHSVLSLTAFRRCFNIFQEEGEELTENTKVRELLKHVQNNQLQDTVKALQVQFDLDGISYTEAANHLTSAVSDLPEYLLAHRVSSLKRIRGGGSEKGKNKFKRDSIYADDGTIFTGYYSNWKSYSKEDCDKVIAEWNKKNMNGVAKNDNKRKLAEIQAITDDIAMMKCTVLQFAATKRNQEEQDEDAPHNDAGNQFGGRKAKSGKWQLPYLFGTILSAFYAMYQFLTKRPRCLLRLVSSMRRRKKNIPGVNPSLPSHGRIELDSHSDTVVLGSNCVVLHHTGKVCEVSPYMDEYDAITDVPVV